MTAFISDVYRSYRAMPLWVQMWVMFILVPVNMASLVFISQPMGLWISFLAIIAIMLNIPVIIYDRGFTKMMALPHLIPWTILLIILLFFRPDSTGAYDVYLWLLLVINAISLIFDYPDALKWLKGGDKPT